MPYVQPGSAPRKEISDEVEEEGFTKRQRFFAFFHRLHKGIVHDFAPLTSLRLPSIKGVQGSAGPGRVKSSRRAPSRKLSMGPDSSSQGSDDNGSGSEIDEHDSDAVADDAMEREEDKAEDMQNGSGQGVQREAKRETNLQEGEQ